MSDIELEQEDLQRQLEDRRARHSGNKYTDDLLGADDRMEPAGKHMGRWYHHNRRRHHGRGRHHSGRHYYHSGAPMKDNRRVSPAYNDSHRQHDHLDGLDIDAEYEARFGRGNDRRTGGYRGSYPSSGGAYYSDDDAGPMRANRREHRDDWHRSPEGGRMMERGGRVGDGFPNYDAGYMPVEGDEGEQFMHDEGPPLLSYVPVAYHEPERFTFTKVFSLAALKNNTSSKSGLVIDLDQLYGNNEHAQRFFSSGANLGGLRIEKLAAHNSHVSLTVRAESHANPKMGFNSIALKKPTVRSPDVKEHSVHAILSKHATYGPNSGMTLVLRHRAPMVAQTTLSSYPGWTVSNLDKNVKPTLSQGIDEISTDHPIAHVLKEQGLLSEEDMASRDSVHVPTEERLAARSALEEEERMNPKVADARSLRLVIGMAYGKDRGGGAPSWGDTTEIADDVNDRDQRVKVIRNRQNSNIAVTGEFVIDYGFPVTVHEDEDGNEVVMTADGRPLDDMNGGMPQISVDASDATAHPDELNAIQHAAAMGI